MLGRKTLFSFYTSVEGDGHGAGRVCPSGVGNRQAERAEATGSRPREGLGTPARVRDRSRDLRGRLPRPVRAGNSFHGWNRALIYLFYQVDKLP